MDVDAVARVVGALNGAVLGARPAVEAECPGPSAVDLAVVMAVFVVQLAVLGIENDERVDSLAAAGFGALL